jgi:hypothetical protein
MARGCGYAFDGGRANCDVLIVGYRSSGSEGVPPPFQESGGYPPPAPAHL